jgi:HD-GYP domain-containing protein (c-di-GMP phosphodiesterase class II)
MTSSESTTADRHLLHDLLDGLSLAGQDAGLAVGIVGSARHAPQPPAHCLRHCLDGQPTACTTCACPFLAGAAANRPDPGTLSDGRCARGYRAAAQATSVGGAPATLITIEGPLATAPATHAAANTLLTQLDSAARLVQRVEQLLEENSGFANEVLQNYEQLNLIFDLTQRIASVTDAGGIEQLLLERVARLLTSDTITIITDQNESRTLVVEGPGVLRPIAQPAVSPEDTAPIAAAVRRTQQAQVAAVPDRQVIAAPLVRLDDHVDVVLASRPVAAPPFSAGDMLLLESLLAFGGQIISNTELHERLRRMSLEVTRALVAAIDKKDHYTSGHSERGGFLTRLTAQELGVPPAQVQYMEWAGLLHDVGKIGIPEEILCKPGKLTPEEFDVIKQHPRMGYDILQPIASLGVVLDGVLYHHEYPDGSGYPEGLQGEQIPLVARIIHVVDTFDALTSTRAYRKAFSIEKACEIIRSEKGVHIDAEVAEAFFRAFEAYRRDNPEDFALRFAGTRDREEEYAR